MKKLCIASFIALTTLSLVLAFNIGTAQSRPQYAKAFAAKYVKADATDPAEKSFAAAVSTAKCTVCHEPGDNRKLRNRYGKELATLIKPANEKDPKKIDEALDKAADVHIDPKDPKSPTYGELIKAGKLPGGEPKKSADDEKK